MNQRQRLISSKIQDKYLVLKITSHARLVNFERSVGAGTVPSSGQPASRLDEEDATMEWPFAEGGRVDAADGDAADGNGTWLARWQRPPNNESSSPHY